MSSALILVCFVWRPALASDPDWVGAVDAAIVSEMHRGDIPALSVAVVENGRIAWSGAYGAATPATRFRLGSISKLFTALAILRLRDAGKFTLDTPVRVILPWFRLADDPVPDTTIRELLLHVGGLPREAPDASWDDQVMPDRAELMRDLSALPRALAEDVEWKYSNLGYALLGLVVEAVSGKSYEDYVREAVLVPLGMDETDPEPRPDSRLAVGYGPRREGGREPRSYLAMGALGPAAGIASTARDLAKLCLWMLGDDSRFLAAHTRREMLRPQAVFPDWSGGQGLGFEIRRVGDGTRIGHGGRAGGYAGRIDIDPAAAIGIVMLTNADDARLTPLFETIEREIAQHRRPPPAVPLPDDWRDYIGRYRSKTGESEIAAIDGRLLWQDPTSPHPERSRIDLVPAGMDRFRFASGALVGEIVTFDRDPAGHVSRMRAAGATDVRE